MAKKPYVFPDEYKEIAIKNGLNLATVYKRIGRGWTLDRAVTQPTGAIPEHLKNNKRVEGMIQSGERPKGKTRGFSYYKDAEDELEKAIKESGLSNSEFIAIAVEYYLKEVVNDEKGKRGRGQSNSSSRNSRAKKKTT